MVGSYATVFFFFFCFSVVNASFRLGLLNNYQDSAFYHCQNKSEENLLIFHVTTSDSANFF